MANVHSLATDQAWEGLPLPEHQMQKLRMWLAQHGRTQGQPQAPTANKAGAVGGLPYMQNPEAVIPVLTSVAYLNMQLSAWHFVVLLNISSVHLAVI